MISKDIFQEINRLTTDLIECGLCDDQNFPIVREAPNKVLKITIGDMENRIYLRNVDYGLVYEEMKRKRMFNMKMIDGALILLQYDFKNEEIFRHRLSFFPSVSLLEFQNNPDVYIMDEIYSDILDRQVVTFPIRFDFDCSDEVYKKIDHPKSHLTLGQYRNCRIPVSAPITPYKFIDFIIRNFYNTAYNKYYKSLTRSSIHFEETIHPDEKKIIFIDV